MTAQLSVDHAAIADLGDRVKKFLAAQHFASFRKLEVTVSGDGVVLHGRVSSFYERQLAAALCRHVAGVRQVVDRLIVSESFPPARAGNPQFPMTRQPT